MNEATKELLSRVEAQVNRVAQEHTDCRERCAAVRTPIYDRIGKLEVAGARADERLKNLAARTGAIVGLAVGLGVSALNMAIQYFAK